MFANRGWSVLYVWLDWLLINTQQWHRNSFTVLLMFMCTAVIRDSYVGGLWLFQPSKSEVRLNGELQLKILTGNSVISALPHHNIIHWLVRSC